MSLEKNGLSCESYDDKSYETVHFIRVKRRIIETHHHIGLVRLSRKHLVPTPGSLVEPLHGYDDKRAQHSS
jgi:hypothetical protein